MLGYKPNHYDKETPRHDSHQTEVYVSLMWRPRAVNWAPSGPPGTQTFFHLNTPWPARAQVFTLICLKMGVPRFYESYERSRQGDAYTHSHVAAVLRGSQMPTEGCCWSQLISWLTNSHWRELQGELGN